MGGKGYKPYTSLTGKKVSGDWEDSDRGAGNKAKRRAGGKVEKKSPTYRAYVLNKEEVEDLKEYSPNVTYQAKGGRKSGKLGKSSVYSLRDKDESKKEFRKSQIKDIKGGYLKTEDFTPHKMIDKKSGKEYWADTEDKHLKYKKMGYVHEEKKPKNCGCGQDPCITYGKKEKVDEAKDAALDYVINKYRKKYGKDAVITKDNPIKPPSEAQKKKNAAERKKRQDADNKAFAARAKKAGYKNPQDYANVVARYGSEDNYNKGKGLGS